MQGETDLQPGADLSQYVILRAPDELNRWHPSARGCQFLILDSYFLPPAAYLFAIHSS